MTRAEGALRALVVCAVGGCALQVEGQDAWVVLADGTAAHKAHAAAQDSAGGVHVARVAETELLALARRTHEETHRCGGFHAFESEEEARAFAANSVGPTRAVTYALDNQDAARALRDSVREGPIRHIIATMSAFSTRYYQSASGEDAALWLHDHWQTLAAHRDDVSATTWTHSWRQPSVILTFQGSESPDEIVIVGGHLDSINHKDGSLAPGADDNASGIATFTEVARAMLATGFRPKRTVQFMGYAAEEVGLRGSQAIASVYKKEAKDVVGVVQLDMTNYNRSSRDMSLVSDQTSSAQNAFLGQLLDTYLKDVSWTQQTCGYSCSDHASWTGQGFRASMPFEAPFSGSNPRIHSSQDRLSLSGGHAYHAAIFARLAAVYVAELAGGTMDPSLIPPNRLPDEWFVDLPPATGAKE